MALRALLVALAALCASCASLEEHVRAEPWERGFAAQGDDAWQWAPAATCVALAPVAFALDDELHDAAAEHTTFTGGDTASGDALVAALGLGALGYACFADGSDGAEVAAEALLATAGATQLLKATIDRRRPSGSSHSSFPSGHTSFAFAAATLLGRELERQGLGEVGWLAYVPAAFVAIDRVEAERHWPSDVVCGALLGVVATNWVWNAHFDERDGLFAHRERAAWRVGPGDVDGRLAFGVTCSW